MAHHSSVVYLDKMWLFGGSSVMGENDKFFCLDLQTYTWEVVKPKKGETPPSRDEHSAVINEADQTMVIFGGFAEGQRKNDVLVYSYQNNEWTSVEVDGP